MAGNALPWLGSVHPAIPWAMPPSSGAAVRIHGHTHIRRKYRVGGVDIHANGRGFAEKDPTARNFTADIVTDKVAARASSRGNALSRGIKVRNFIWRRYSLIIGPLKAGCHIYCGMWHTRVLSFKMHYP
jgi:hypothetical protein